MRRLALVVAVCTVMLFCGVPSAKAVDPNNRGLLITPIRQYKKVEPQKTTSDKLTVANLTKKPIDVTLSIERFSVVNYSYDYTFESPREDWVSISAPKLHLESGESKQVQYSITAPKTAEPGGHYFTILASTSLKPGEEVRAATMLYVTVAGKLVQTSNIIDDSVPFISFGGDIPFRFNIKNTGNAHFFAYTSGKLEGLSAQGEKNDAAHIILPQTTRTVEGYFSAPLLPGVYKAVYGFKTDSGASTSHEKYIIYAPLWAWALLGGIIWFLVIWLRRPRNNRNTRRVY